MAWRILQFGILFAVGYTLESNSDSAFSSAAFETPNIELSLKLKDPQDVIVRKEQSALLKCPVESRKGPVQITWFYNDTKIEEDSNRIVGKNGDLYIPKITTGKSSNEVQGDYRCLAKNRIGALLSNVAKLKVASMEKEFSINPTNSTVYLSQPTILRCGIQSTPPVDIQWEFDFNPILPHQTSYVPLPNGILLIQNSRSSLGAYRCKATNYLLNKIRYSKVAYITLLPNLPEATIPSFLPLDISPNVTVLLGETLSIYCAVMGWPTPTVQWLNDKIVVSNNSILQVPDTKLSDAGNYVCTAHNNIGSISQNFRVVIQQKPVFVVKPNSKSYPAAITARLDCRATGFPEPKIVWLKDGQPLKFDSRVRKQTNGVIFSHTFSNDSGMYQCVATNAVGRVWTAVQIDIINISQTPQPQNLKCRQYNSSTICLTWKAPKNVSVTGYSVHSFYNDNGNESVGPDYAINVTSLDAGGLIVNTDYTFYVRLYSTGASDPSEKVTCRTGVVGDRDLSITTISNGSVFLNWSEISSDVSCTGETFPYKVQWKIDRPSQHKQTRKKSTVIPDLIPGMNYSFRVVSLNNKDRDDKGWVSYVIPNLSSSSSVSDLENTTSHEIAPQPPLFLKAVAVSSSVIKLNWGNTDKKAKFFMVCYGIDGEKSGCEEGKFLNTSINKIRIKKLKPNTMYVFRVRAHNSDGVPGIFSKPVFAVTLADVPSAVTDLKYKVINASTINLQWHKPKEPSSSNIKKYIISYSPDLNRPLEKWPNVTVYSNDGNFPEESVLLGNLNITTQYTILVMAVSDIGVGKPATLGVSTKIDDAKAEISTGDAKYNQKVGFIVGTVIALLCIVCCISCILVRRKCVKRRALARSRMTNSNNYYPAVAHYASQVGEVQVRLEETCDNDEQESPFLVADGLTANIPPVQADHIDTKGGDEFPNGHTNGTAKPYMNGHVHIRENPQFYAFDCNGGISKKPDQFTPLRFEEDSNSNVKPSKFYDLHKLFENSKKLKSSTHHRCNPHFGGQSEDMRSSCDEVHSSESSRDVSLNCTQTTCLNETLDITEQNKRKSPILGPNG